MFDFHKDKRRYFDMQYKVTRDFIIPFISEVVNINRRLDVLEIGCAEAGVLMAFCEHKHKCLGIELSADRVEIARQYHQENISKGLIKFISQDIYDIDPNKDLENLFDLIILKDVIEHIHDQAKFMGVLKKFLKPSGKVFFGFPPWQMPFGGHQQVAKSKVLSSLPYYHLLPRSIYKKVLEIFGESKVKVNNMLEIKDTGISVERFEKILKTHHYKIDKRNLFFTNPIYKYKFGLKVWSQLGFIQRIPRLRNYVSTCAYYIVSI